jgi:hypothetical protein
MSDDQSATDSFAIRASNAYSASGYSGLGETRN